MTLGRRQFLFPATGAAALPAVSRVARAQAYPTRPITMIVPLAAGGALDAAARVLAEPMRRSLGPPVIIENGYYPGRWVWITQPAGRRSGVLVLR
jgi:tripartite-type tricarboxylate transporter receptor subunit TctC